MRVRLFTALLGLAISAGLFAQTDSSLTPEFAGLNAKERNRIAKKEQEDARNDIAFNAVMGEADALFQGQRFEEALAKYQEARKLRPLNVYPKVKIQDLQAHLSKQQEGQKQPEQPAPPAPPMVERVVEPAIVVQEDLPVPNESKGAVPPKPRDPTPANPESKQAHGTNRTHAVPIERGVSAGTEEHLTDGLEERSFIEGRAVVLEHRFVRQGVLTIYRKVTHPWGQVIHFRDGITISEREWMEAFPNR
ncbi:MAG: hypothetical protein IPJ85_17560 [Flavobacteriales bacterium]|nr:hypothetical protein [Flavobacteriales bacterium]